MPEDRAAQVVRMTARHPKAAWPITAAPGIKTAGGALHLRSTVPSEPYPRGDAGSGLAGRPPLHTDLADDVALFRRYGLPYPIFAHDKTTTGAHNTWRLRIGQLAHDVIAEAAPLLGTLTNYEETTALLGRVTYDRVHASGFVRPNRVHLRAYALALKYAAEFLPPAPTVFVGREVATDGRKGRIDLIWEHPSLGIFIDELKTDVIPNNRDEETLDQVARYLNFGRTAYSKQFAGVRLVTLGDRDSALMFGAEGLGEPLTDSRFSKGGLAVSAAPSDPEGLAPPSEPRN